LDEELGPLLKLKPAHIADVVLNLVTGKCFQEYHLSESTTHGHDPLFSYRLH